MRWRINWLFYGLIVAILIGCQSTFAPSAEVHSPKMKNETQVPRDQTKQSRFPHNDLKSVVRAVVRDNGEGRVATLTRDKAVLRRISTLARLGFSRKSARIPNVVVLTFKGGATETYFFDWGKVGPGYNIKSMEAFNKICTIVEKNGQRHPTEEFKWLRE